MTALEVIRYGPEQSMLTGEDPITVVCVCVCVCAHVLAGYVSGQNSGCGGSGLEDNHNSGQQCFQ